MTRHVLRCLFKKKCFRYFEVNATQEILDEVLPLIFPWSGNSQMLSPLSAFLPVGLPPQYAKQGHELWFDQLMTLWDTCYNVPGGISVSNCLFKPPKYYSYSKF